MATPKSPGLTPLDFFFIGTLKEYVNVILFNVDASVILTSDKIFMKFRIAES